MIGAYYSLRHSEHKKEENGQRKKNSELNCFKMHVDGAEASRFLLVDWLPLLVLVFLRLDLIH